MPLTPDEIKLEFDLFLSQADHYGVDRLYDARQLCHIFLLDYLMSPLRGHTKDIEKLVDEVKAKAEKDFSLANKRRSKKRKPSSSAEEVFQMIPLENFYKPEQIIWETINGDLITVEGCAGSGKTEFLKQLNAKYKQLAIDSRSNPIKINNKNVRFFCSSLYIPDPEAYKGNSSTDIEESYTIYALEVSEDYKKALVENYTTNLNKLSGSDLKKLSKKELKNSPSNPSNKGDQIKELTDKFVKKIEKLRYDSRILKLDGMIGQPWGKGKHLFKGWELDEGTQIVPDVPFNLLDEVKNAKNSYFVLLANLNNNILKMESIVNPEKGANFIIAYNWLRDKLKNLEGESEKIKEQFIQNLLDGEIKYKPENAEEECELLPPGEDTRLFATSLVQRLYVGSKFLGMAITGTEPERWMDAAKKFIQIIYKKCEPTENGLKYEEISREEYSRLFNLVKDYIQNKFGIDKGSEYTTLVTSGKYDMAVLMEDTLSRIKNFVPNMSKLFIQPIKPDSISDEIFNKQLHNYSDYAVQFTAADIPSTILDAYLNWVRVVDWYQGGEKYLAPLGSEKYDKIWVNPSKRANSLQVLDSLGV